MGALTLFAFLWDCSGEQCRLGLLLSRVAVPQFGWVFWLAEIWWLFVAEPQLAIFKTASNFKLRNRNFSSHRRGKIYMDRRARYTEKRDFVIHWLLEFGYSTPKILCEALGLDRKNQGHFFTSLKKSGLFVTTRYPLIREYLILLSYPGKEFAGLLSEKAEAYNAVPSRCVTSGTFHNLCVQQAIVNLGYSKLPFCFTYEKHLEHIDRHKRPDALINIGEEIGLTALEVELTQKSEKRIFMAFLEHVQHFENKTYGKTHYVFPNESICKSYVDRFSRDKWSRFYRDRYNKIRGVMDADNKIKTATVSDKIRSRFEFGVNPLYSIQ